MISPGSHGEHGKIFTKVNKENEDFLILCYLRYLLLNFSVISVTPW
jgi:hypothetical protein